ncbi:hypothetical protein LAZ67_4000104 [Cordylochernes scorpioides]|uniref:Integrase catalytic domain-containing protein n=1 Tax=Cordylochernes scorpioides TaxID=51811 RepID=A0ABY6KCH4_9ARAC|nr:hypothetical protein LAZ67_4000104 [Cordylochernes scorpioides]
MIELSEVSYYRYYRITPSPITNDHTKFSYLISLLPPSTAIEVREFIISPPHDNKYDALKKAIIKCTADSEFKKLQQLLTQEELGDRLPSQLLRHLRQLIGESKAVSDTTLKMLWMQRLPKNIQIILTTQEQASLNSLADLADRVTEITSSPSSSTSTLEKELASLRAEISALKIDLNKKEESIPRSRSRSSSSSRKSSPNSYRKYNPNGSWCWYHFRFKHHARKCISPCTFNKKAKNQQENSNNNQFMDEVTKGLDFVFVYIDDVLIASKNENDHIQHLHIIFKRLSDQGLTINISKSVFGKPSLEFLGHIIDNKGIKPLPEKIRIVKDFPQPNSTRQLQRFIGLVNFYHRFIKNSSHILAPLYSLLKTKSPNASLNWTSDTLEAFQNIKNALAENTILNYPQPNSTLSVLVDASNVAVGGVLQQLNDTAWEPISFFSKKLSPAETKYSAFDRELLAAFLSVKHFSYFLDGKTFMLFTDHKPLTYAFTSKSERSPRQERHLNYLSQFSMDIRYVKGSENIVADTLSRIEIETFNHTKDLTSLIGTNRIRTTAYNPAANGLVERLHRQIKAAIMASGNTINWIDALPLVLLGIRTSYKEDLKCTAAEMVFGTTLNLPADLLTNSEFKNPDPSNFATQLKNYMSRIRPQPTRQTKQNNIFSHKDLDTCSHVFVRKDFVKRALSPPYEGPFPVVSRSSKTFTVKINDQNKVISVNRLKPAFIENTPQSFHDSSILPPMPDGAEETTPKTSSYTTRYGRHVRFRL